MLSAIFALLSKEITPNCYSALVARVILFFTSDVFFKLIVSFIQSLKDEKNDGD